MGLDVPGATTSTVIAANRAGEVGDRKVLEECLTKAVRKGALLQAPGEGTPIVPSTAAATGVIMPEDEWNKRKPRLKTAQGEIQLDSFNLQEGN